MPGDGENSAANSAREHTIIHGAGEVKDPHVARADNTAPLPEHEKGEGLEGMNASGGQSQGLSRGPDRGQGGGKCS